MLWKYAVHSIAWGDESLETILADAKSAGYTGVELFQHPDELGGVEAVLRAFEVSGLHLVGVPSGSFDDRCRFVREIAALWHMPIDDPSLPYVYVDEWRESDRRFSDALGEGFRIALHPHMYKPVQTWEEADQILQNHPKLGFLPDTAHFKVAGDDAVTAINKFATRMVAVHLKDWQEDVGRSYQFYARGFCELGEGDVDLERILDAILRSSFSGWLVVEQDSTTDPIGSARTSLAWLRKRLVAGYSAGGAT